MFDEVVRVSSHTKSLIRVIQLL